MITAAKLSAHRRNLAGDQSSYTVSRDARSLGKRVKVSVFELLGIGARAARTGMRGPLGYRAAPSGRAAASRRGRRPALPVVLVKLGALDWGLSSICGSAGSAGSTGSASQALRLQDENALALQAQPAAVGEVG